MASSSVAIANLALQKLGNKTRIVSLTEDSPAARSINACYTAMRDAELRKHPWNFAIKRDELAADPTAPVGDSAPANYFTLPSDFIRLLPTDSAANLNDMDWRVEGKKIATNYSAPLAIRYVYRVTDENEFDALFVDVLACRIAWQTCEQITQSNTKKADVAAEYKDRIREAKAANAIERNAYDEPAPDTWDTARY